jgi:hypothetical protein
LLFLQEFEVLCNLQFFLPFVFLLKFGSNA